MKFQFKKIKLSKDSIERLNLVNRIITEYQKAGYRLTLRQLYYQLVSRNVIPNKDREYKNLSSLLTKGRMCGIVDWDVIEDRLRIPYTPPSWNNPGDILNACINQYECPRMKGQDNYMEVWVEKDALSGVLRRVTEQYHVPILVNRGYSSASAMYDAFNRFMKAHKAGQAITILYLGDFDPSGVDMIRDVEARTLEFFGGYWDCEDPDYLNDCILDNGLRFKVVPIALTREQIDQYEPPPNPAKRSDPRAGKFIDEHGGTSWEVDALPPEVLHELVESNIKSRIDPKKYQAMIDKEDDDKAKLEELKEYL